MINPSRIRFWFLLAGLLALFFCVGAARYGVSTGKRLLHGSVIPLLSSPFLAVSRHTWAEGIGRFPFPCVQQAPGGGACGVRPLPCPPSPLKAAPLSVAREISADRLLFFSLPFKGGHNA